MCTGRNITLLALAACIRHASAFVQCGDFPPGRTIAVKPAFGTSSSTDAPAEHGRPTYKNTLLHLSRESNEEESSDGKLGSDIRRAFLASAAAALTYNVVGAVASPPGFKRVPTQFVAALGDPDASSGTGAESWGLWPVDPGPRGVRLGQYSQLVASGGETRAGWVFDEEDWWLEEHGLIMEKPDFPLAPGRYLVTGGRLVTTVLEVSPPDGNTGARKWSLENGKLYDVTHLPCRAARYRPNSGGGSPATAKQSDFPVTPGAKMPEVAGCDKQDYAVLFVIGVEG